MSGWWCAECALDVSRSVRTPSCLHAPAVIAAESAADCIACYPCRCVLDTKPREDFTAESTSLLGQLALLVMREAERRAEINSAQANATSLRLHARDRWGGWLRRAHQREVWSGVGWGGVGWGWEGRVLQVIHLAQDCQ